jgi:hypothetical protein
MGHQDVLDDLRAGKFTDDLQEKMKKVALDIAAQI